jgi:phosphoglycerate dehydrogenase-like enzyme
VTERPVVVILGAAPDDPPPGIEAAVAFADLRLAPGPAELADALPGASALFFWRAEREWLVETWPRASDLRWIQTASDGVDGLLFPELVASDVEVTNGRGVFDEPIAEWVIAAIGAFATGLAVSVRDTVARRWDDERWRDRIAGSRLLVVGPGPIGRTTARRAAALGMEVDAVGRHARDDGVFGRIRGPEELHGALGLADHVLDSLPLAPGTHAYFDETAFAAMRTTARFYNVGRGGTVDQAALIAALRDGRIASAALDVFEEEPLAADSPLWSMPNVIVSPHVCGDFDGWERVVVELFVENLGRFVRGEPLVNAVDPVAGFGVEPGP